MPSKKETRAAWVVVAVVLLLGAAAFQFDVLPWPLVLLEHFPVQYGAGALVIGAIVGIRSNRMGSAVLLAAGCWMIGDGLGWMRRSSLSDAGEPSFRILTANIWLRNDDSASLLRLLDEARADIAVLQEVSPGCAGMLAEQTERFEVVANPTATILVRRGGVVSFIGSEPAHEALTAVGPVVRLAFRDEEIQLLPVHTSAPLDPSRLQDNRAQLTAIREWAARRQVPVIVAGDFNSARSGSAFKGLLHHGRLVDLTQDAGFLATWPFYPAHPWMQILGTQIDHCVASPEFSSKGTRRLEYLPLNHRTIVTEIAWHRSRQE